jgi:Zn-dependent metalloprotease
MRTKTLLLAVLAAAATARAAPSPDRLAVAHRALRAAAPMQAGEGLAVRSSLPNREGRLIVRFDQTFQGHRVFGASAIAHVMPDGTAKVIKDKRLPDLSAWKAPFIDEARAVQLAIKKLGLKGPTATPPEAELVLFPAQFVGGITMGVDAKGRQVVDRRLTVHPQPAAPYVWAYEVKLFVRNDADGLASFDLVVDAVTGRILRADNRSENFTPVPSQATGTGYYSGTVTLDDSRLLDGTYALYDTTRGTLPNLSLNNIVPDGSGWTQIGMQVWWEQHTPACISQNFSFLYQENPTNIWGDGQQFDSCGHESSPNGQSAGVDALYGTATTWDFFKTVFGRDGFDGQGTSAVAWILRTDRVGNGDTTDNASYQDGVNAVFLGKGSWPLNPNGLKPLNDLDVVAHEWVHGFSAASTLFSGVGGEEGALAEGTSDFLSQMVVAWSKQRGPTIPDAGTPWELGKGITADGNPLRWYDQPAKDGHSADRYYDGIGYLDPHYASGPLRRALFILAHGASSDPSDPSYSPFLPQGMAGIGNDAAARLWFKTVSERLIGNGTGSLKYADARSDAIATALEMFPTDPSKVIAVENAFAAANIGDAHGAAPHTQVVFAPFRNGDWISTEMNAGLANRQFFPRGETVVPRVSVLNNANTAVTWSLGGPSLMNGGFFLSDPGGIINPDGSWTTPWAGIIESITATSVADPKQFAEGRISLINTDTDQDRQNDALDLGGVSFSWFLSEALNPSHSVFEIPVVDDEDVALIVDAFHNAWPAI